MDYSSERNHRCRILEYQHRGLTFLTMENRLLRMTILVDKGADIIEILYKPKDIDFMWKAPGGIRASAKHIPTIASALGNNLDYYEGGWHESLPGGGPFIHNGSEQGLHGEVALIPWSYYVEEDTAGRIAVVLKCRTNRYPFHVVKRIRMVSNSAVIEIEESITNESPEEIEFMWGQHPTYGKPFLDENCRIDIPARRFMVCKNFNSPTSFFQPGFKGDWPKTIDKHGKEVDLSIIPPDGVKSADLLYLEGLDEGWYAITNTQMNLGIGLVWDIAIFPYVWFWKVFHGLPGYPWYGRTFNIGLEPWTSPSNFNDAKRAGTTRKIKGYETLNTGFKVIIFEGITPVNKISRDGRVS